MKVSVALQGSGKEAAAVIAQSLTVRPEETVGAVKERLALLEPAAALPGARLLYAGKELDDETRFADSGVKEGASLDLVAGASAEDFAQQLEELLQAQDLPLEELGLLYSHRHGATAGQVLKLLGRDETLSQFLQGSKQFVVEAGRVRAAAAARKPAESGLLRIPEDDEPPRAEGAKVSVAVRLQTPCAGEVLTDVVLDVGAADTVQTLKEKVSEIEMIPFSDKDVVLDGAVLEDGLRLLDCGINSESRVELLARATEQGLTGQLAKLLEGRGQRVLSPDELSLLFCCTYGAPVARALKLLGLKESFRSFLKRQGKPVGRFSRGAAQAGGAVQVMGEGGAAHVLRFAPPPE